MLNLVRLLFFVALALVLIFVWHTTQGLPEMVSSGQDWQGRSKGMMSRGAYLATQFGLLLGLPLLTVALPLWLARRGGPGLNIPHKDYWLAPERREHTLRRLAMMFYLMGLAMTLFLGWLHLDQLRTHGPDSGDRALRFFVTMGVFGGFMLAWVLAMLRMFRRP